MVTRKIKLVDAEKTTGERAVVSRILDLAAAPSVPGSFVKASLGGTNLPLPLVLAGPMVRRAEVGGVWLWLCTPTPVKVDARVFLDEANPLGVGTATSVEFGDRLHVTMVQVTARPDPFPTDTLLSYNMDITSTRDEPSGDVGLQVSDIAYSGTFPTFLLPSPGAKTVVMYGSCRKIKGAGKDVMRAADDYISKRATQVAPNAPGLLNESALSDLSSALAHATATSAGPVLIASPPPVFGHVGFERAQYEMVLHSNSLTRSNEAFYTYDYESWGANKQWFFRFLDCIQRFGKQKVVIFGGDVHYACTAIVRYQLDWNGLPPVEALHLTSSAIKNRLRPGGWNWTAINDGAASGAATLSGGLLPSPSGDGQDAALNGDVENNWSTFAEKGAGSGNVHVYVHYPKICDEGQFMASSNNIGVFVMDRSAVPAVTNSYVDENGAEQGRMVAVAWPDLMKRVPTDASIAASSRAIFLKGILSGRAGY